MAHLTVSELKDLIRAHKTTQCPSMSGRKADLLRVVERLGLYKEPVQRSLPSRKNRLIKPLFVKSKTFVEGKEKLSKAKSPSQRILESSLSPRQELLLLDFIRLGKVPKSVRKGGPGISVGNLTKNDKKLYKTRVASLGASEKRQIADITIRLKPGHIIMFKKRLGKLSVAQSKTYLSKVLGLMKNPPGAPSPRKEKKKKFAHVIKNKLLVPDSVDEKLIEKYIKKKVKLSPGSEEYAETRQQILRFVSAGIRAKPKKADGSNLFTKRGAVRFLLFKK